MLFLVKLSPEFSSVVLEEAKETWALSLFLLAGAAFPWDSSVLTAAPSTAGAATVCNKSPS